MTVPTTALIRRPPRSYRTLYARLGIGIDLDLADRQHRAYVDALVSAGLAIETIQPDDQYADCVFIEDTAVVWQDRALRTRMAPHREGEQSPVIAHLRPTHQIVILPADATLDGGDVMHSDHVSYVGRSSRTNASGAAALRAFLSPRPVIEVIVERCLHLKTAATWLGDGTVLAARELIDVNAFESLETLYTAPGEMKAANTLRVGNELLMLDGYPGTAQVLANFAATHRLALHPLGMSEFEKGDGSLTCLSILQ